jgi:GT2 family glycosyltransferase
MSIRISAIIPNFKQPKLLRAAVVSVFAQDLPKDEYELIVVDSSPTEEPAQVLRELESQAPCRFRWFRKEPEGAGSSRNYGADRAEGEILAFTDHDCEADPGWLRNLLAAFDRPEIGIVQGKTLPDPKGRPGIFTHYQKVTSENPIFHGCNVAYRREAFQQAGGFWRKDLLSGQQRMMGGEDVDLGWRVKKAGWQTRFAPEAVVFHAIMPIGLQRWFVTKQEFIYPKLVRDHPELREYMFGRYFYSRTQALFLLALLGVAGAFFHWAALVAIVPYFWSRASEPSATLKGPLRLLRPLLYIPRDAITLGMLIAASIKFRSLLL